MFMLLACYLGDFKGNIFMTLSRKCANIAVLHVPWYCVSCWNHWPCPKLTVSQFSGKESRREPKKWILIHYIPCIYIPCWSLLPTPCSLIFCSQEILLQLTWILPMQPSPRSSWSWRIIETSFFILALLYQKSGTWKPYICIFHWIDRVFHVPFFSPRP